MNRKKLFSVCCVVGAVLCAQGVERVWRGGEGDWSDTAKWNPAGVPGGAVDDIAAVPASDVCVLHITDDVALARLHTDISGDGGTLTFDVASGVTFAADLMRLRASRPMECVVTGGGTFALTNVPFGVGYNWTAPSHFTVSGANTLFLMPKPAGSGLYVGAIADKLSSVDNVFRVTAGARAVISNATCVGQGYIVDQGLAPTKSGGRLLVDDGGYFYGGLYLFIGRDVLNVAANRSEAAVCAVTNGTIEADFLTLGSCPYTLFTGSNALVRANNIELPQLYHYGHSQLVEFDDSVVEATKMIRLMACGQVNSNVFQRCRLASPEFVLGAGMSVQNDVVFDACELFASNYYFGMNGSTNNVTRLVGSTLTSTNNNNVFVGYEKGSSNNRVELDGGTLNCKTVMIGKPGSICGGVRVTGSPTLNIAEWIIGDALGEWTVRAQGSWSEFAATTNTLPRLLVGAGSVNAWMLVTNASVTVAIKDKNHHFVVGRDAGATGNVLRVAQGGVCTYRTSGIGGDVYVGQDAGANCNRLEIDGGTFAYDRRFMAVGFNGSSNVLSLANGARLEAADAQLHVGYKSGANGNRFAMLGGSVATVRMFNMQHGAVAEFAGAGNVLTVGDENVSMMDGDSFVFRPSPEAAATPVVTVNKVLTYGPNRPITVDVADVGMGVYRLMSCAAGVPAVDDVPVTFENLPSNRAARLRRSADGKELTLSVAPTGTLLLFR